MNRQQKNEKQEARGVMTLKKRDNRYGKLALKQVCNQVALAAGAKDGR
jgi:hypothetical protein